MRRSRHRIDPYVRAVEKLLKPLRGPVSKNSAVRRKQTAAEDITTSRALGISPVDVATEEHTLTVSDHPDARLRVYWPEPERAPAADSEGLPILVYFFGGGFTMAGIDWVAWDATFRIRARDAGVIVIAGEYSHAPEVKFPTQPEQCWSVLEWACHNARSIGGDPDRIAIGGASSGGNLAAAVTLMNRDRHDHPLRLQILEMPTLDLTMEHVDAAGLDGNIPGLLLRKVARHIVKEYLGRKRASRRHRYASPLLATSLVGLPPAAIYTAEFDPLRGDGEAYARALTAAGVPATTVRYMGQTHSSGALRDHVPAADHLHRDIVATLRTLHEAPRTYPDPNRRIS